MIRNLFCVLTAVVWSCVSFVPAVLAGLFTLNSDNTGWWAREMWSRVLLWAGGARLEVEGGQNVDPKRPTIYVSNHQSTIDICAIFVAVPVPFRFVAKKQLKSVPFIGWYLALTNHVFVDRRNQKAAIESLEAAGKKIRNGISIVVFPEGTRSDDGRVLPFKKGPFALALQARVPIVPVTIEGSGQLMPKNSWRITPGPIRVKIGKPIDTTAYSVDDREGLARAVRDVIIQQSRELGGKGGNATEIFAAPGVEGAVRTS